MNKERDMGGVLERVHKYREKLRMKGIRPIQIWVPDTRRSGFAEECRRQSLLVKHEQQCIAVTRQQYQTIGLICLINTSTNFGYEIKHFR